ncbi:MAG TPA: hypothetical protein VGB28_07390 [Actinomycetota bacterium]
MRIRLSDRARGVLVVGGLSLSVLVATAAVAKLALPGLLDGGHPDPDVARPVSGVNGPILLPIIEVSPVEAGPSQKKDPHDKAAKGKAKGKDKAKSKAKGKNKAKSQGGAGSGGQGSGGEQGGHTGGSGGKGQGSAAGGTGKGKGKGS